MNTPSEQYTAPNASTAATHQKTVLLVAFHFPPDASSTGRLRPLAFARHLPVCGWRPIVLAPNAGAYDRLDPQGDEQIPDNVRVYRTRALDTRRHFGWRGKYPSWLAAPDRSISWWPGAVAKGLSLIRQYRIDAIWSTYPIATTHLIGWTLARMSGLPWIADFRDPMVPDGTAIQRSAVRIVEKRAMTRADRIVFTTPGAREQYALRFPERAEHLRIVPNGYEEQDFPTIMRPESARRGESRRIELLHSGLLYKHGRNPGPFFEALARLKKAGTISVESLTVTLRASGNEPEYQTELERLGVDDIVELAGPIGYREALDEQASADGLLLFQGPEFNAQIPAKIFEYLRIGRPVFALSDIKGDTANLLDKTKGAVLAPIADVDAIAEMLASFLQQLRAGDFTKVDMSILKQYSRRACTQRLSLLLDEVKNP